VTETKNSRRRSEGIRGDEVYKEKEKEEKALLAICFHPGFLIGLFFDPEDGGDMFLLNFD
jgi:hypothetical protein